MARAASTAPVLELDVTPNQLWQMALEHMLPIQEEDISLLELLGIGTSPRERKTPWVSVAGAELYTSAQPPGSPVWLVST